MKRTTINKIVEAILNLGAADASGDYRDVDLVANEATIYLKTAAICEEDGIDAAMKYFTETHGEDEYKMYLRDGFDPEEISLCKSCYCMTHTLGDGRCGKCKEIKEGK